MSRIASITVASLIALAPALARAARPATPAGDCSALPRPHMRVRLTASEGVKLDLRNVTVIVDRIWSDEGIELEWIPDSSPLSWDGVSAWIHLRGGRIAGAEHSLGTVRFTRGRPERFIEISVDATIARVERSLARDLQLQPTSVFHLLFADGGRIVERSVAYTMAHELGHFVLGQARHTSDGLMRATFDPVLLRSAPHLDRTGRQLLADRMAVGVLCEGR